MSMISRLPCASVAMISLVPQLQTHRRPPCQRGDSPKARPVVTRRAGVTDCICMGNSLLRVIMAERALERPLSQQGRARGLRSDSCFVISFRKVADRALATHHGGLFVVVGIGACGS